MESVSVCVVCLLTEPEGTMVTNSEPECVVMSIVYTNRAYKDPRADDDVVTS